jgi:hypothetical protein
MSELVLYLYRHILGPYKFKFRIKNNRLEFNLGHNWDTAYYQRYSKFFERYYIGGE